jgi:hypothetical protein
MLYQSVGVNVGSKTMNIMDSPVRHQCANGRLQELVLTASRWADGTLDSPVRYPVCHYNSTSKPCALGFLRGGKTFPGPTWPHPIEGAPDSPVHTGQSGAPLIETLISIFCCFSNRFSF